MGEWIGTDRERGAAENPQKIVPICAAILIDRRDGVPRLLLGKRAATRRSYPGVWDAIGGHVEAGETAEQALVRELGEEIGVTPLAWWEVGRVVVPASGPGGGLLDLRLYAVTAWDGTPRNPQPEEHDAIAWFGLDEACGLELADPSYPEIFRRVARGA